jgi:hypothetical protein
MTERERLYELIVDADNEFFRETPCGTAQERIEKTVEHLLANGVLLPPVRVGDTVYYIVGGYYKSPDNCKVSEPCKVVEISYKIGAKYRQLAGFITNKGTRYSFDGIGKTVFLTREEAEAELEKRRKEVKNE